MSVAAPEQVFFDPVLFAETFLKILNSQKKKIALRYNAMQRQFLADRTGRDIILKARQHGFSTLIQAEYFRIAITQPATILTLTHLDTTTQAMRRMADRFYNNLPENFRPNRKYANNTLTTYLDFDSEVIIGTAGSTHGGRGTTLSHAHLSEFAFYTDPEAIMSGALQSGNPEVVIESTANGAQGLFYELCNNAQKGKGGWKLHFFPWFVNPDYALPLSPREVLEYDDEEKEQVAIYRLTPEQIKWRRVKKDETGMLFDQEYPSDATTCFLTSGSSVFSVYTLYTPDEQQALDDHYYVMGVDWSGGGSGDADSHAVSIMDASDFREVFLYTTRQRDDDAVLDEIVELVKRWKVITVTPELNSMGNTLAARLHKFLHERGHNWGRNARGESLAPVVSGKFMLNVVKDNLVKDFKAALRDGLKLVDDPTGNDELLAFQSEQKPSGLWSYGAKSGKHDDTVIARLLALAACKGY